MIIERVTEVFAVCIILSQMRQYLPNCKWRRRCPRTHPGIDCRPLHNHKDLRRAQNCATFALRWRLSAANDTTPGARLFPSIGDWVRFSCVLLRARWLQPIPSRSRGDDASLRTCAADRPSSLCRCHGAIFRRARGAPLWAQIIERWRADQFITRHNMTDSSACDGSTAAVR